MAKSRRKNPGKTIAKRKKGRRRGTLG